MKPKFRSLIAAFAPLSRSSLIVVASLCVATSVHADQTWTGDTLDGFWTSTGNWSGAAIPGASDVAIFNVTSDTNTATTLGATFSIKGLKIVDPIAAVSIAAGNTLTLDSSGIDMSTATQNLTVNAPLVLGVAQSWNVQTGRTLTVSGGVSGTGPLTTSGAGIVALGGTNAYTGLTNITGGTLNFAGAASTPGTGLSISGGALVTVGNTASDNVGAVTFTTGGGTFNSGLSVSSSRVMTVGNIVVDSGVTGTMGYNGRTSLCDGASTATGLGTLVVNVNGASATANNTDGRFYINGNWSGFTGTFKLVANNANSTVQLNANGGTFSTNSLANAVIDLSAPVSGVMSFLGRFSTNGTMQLGALTGTAASAIRPVSSAGAGTFQIGTLGTDTTFAGGITNGGAVVMSIAKLGAGTLTLTNTTDLTYTGATTVTEGSLKINGVKSGVGATTVNGTSTTGRLTGSGSVAGTTTVATGGILIPGDAGVGNLTLSSLTLNTGSILKLGATPAANKAVVTSTLNLQSGINVDVNGFGTAGTYTIIDVTGATVLGTVATAFTAINVDGSKIYSFATTGTAITMTISTSDPNNFWNVDGPGSWATAANWTKNPTIPNAVSAIAKFGPGPGGVTLGFSASFAVTLDGNKTVGLLSFNDDYGSVVTLDPGTVTPGTLNIDDGAVTGNIVVVTGSHVINAPVAVDAQGVAVDVGSSTIPHSLTINGVLSGSSAAVTKTGTGDLFLAGNNSYGGGTVLGGGRINVNSATSMGLTSAAATFSGGTLQLGATLSGITRSYLLTGANSAIIDTNGFDLGYGGVISPVSGATGGLTKNGAGIMTLTAAQTYTGTTSVGGGELLLATGGSISGGSVNTTTAGGGLIHTTNTGTITATFGTLNPQTGGLFMDAASGNVTFSGSLTAINTTSNGNSSPIRVTSGTLSASSIQLGRTGLSTTVEPVAAPVNTNLYLSGGAVNVSGDLIVGAYTGSTAPNSSVVTRVDGGTLTVGGAISIGVNNAGRWSYFDMNGGTLVNTGALADSGLVIGGPLIGKAAFLMHAGTATVERIQFGRGIVDGQGLLNISGGTLYVGSGGISLGSTGVYTSEIRLSGGTLGAKASWSSTMPFGITVASTIKAADAAAAPFDISIAGVISGVGGLDKTGTGALTLSGANTYTGPITVTAGSLNITGDSSAATGAVTVLSAAKLGGNGNIGGNVTIQSGAHHALAVAATSGTQVTRTITGTLDLQAGNILDLTSAGPVAGGVYILATATGGITGTPTTVNLAGGVTGTVAVSGNNLQLTVIGGSGYDSWKAANAGGQASNLDWDLDGVSNGVEYFMNSAAGFTANPSVVTVGAVRTVTWPKSATFSGSYIVQTSSNLSSWATAVSGIVDNGTSVQYTMPTGAGNIFVRLVVTPNN